VRGDGMIDKIDIFAAYKKHNPFSFQMGMSLLICALFTWIIGGKDSYLNLGFGFLVIYIIQYLIEIYGSKKEKI
jgi:hypothetical protein